MKKKTKTMKYAKKKFKQIFILITHGNMNMK